MWKVPGPRSPPPASGAGDDNEQAVSRGHNNCPIIHQLNFDNFNQEKYLRSEFELVIKYINIYCKHLNFIYRREFVDCWWRWIFSSTIAPIESVQCCKNHFIWRPSAAVECVVFYIQWQRSAPSLPRLGPRHGPSCRPWVVQKVSVRHLVVTAQPSPAEFRELERVATMTVLEARLRWLILSELKTMGTVLMPRSAARWFPSCLETSLSSARTLCRLAETSAIEGNGTNVLKACIWQSFHLEIQNCSFYLLNIFLTDWRIDNRFFSHRYWIFCEY